jgi:deoxycitidine kinase
MVKRISIEGNLAAGKSTLLHLLELLDVSHLYEIAPEPVAQWQHVADTDAVVGDDVPHELDESKKEEDTNILSLFYRDP